MSTVKWQLHIIDPEGHTRSIAVDTAQITIGRNPECDVQLDSRKVSGQHVVVMFDGERPEVKDLGSTNGSRLAGIELQPNIATHWGEGDALLIEGFAITLVRLPTFSTTGASPSPTGGFLQYASRGVAGARHQVGSLYTHPYVRRGVVLLVFFGVGVLVGYALRGAQTPTLQNREPPQLNKPTTIPTWTSTPVGAVDSLDATPSLVVTAIPVITLSSGGGGRPIATRAPTRTPTVTPVRTSMNSTTGSDLAIATPPEIVAASRAMPERIWDARLSQLGIVVEDASVAPGQSYWRLVKALWRDKEESGGSHHIYVETLDQSGLRTQDVAVRVSWGDGSQLLTPEAKPAEEYPMNFDMYAAGYAYHVNVDGQASDMIRNLGMGTIAARQSGEHTSFLLTFQLAHK